MSTNSTNLAASNTPRKRGKKLWQSSPKGNNTASVSQSSTSTSADWLGPLLVAAKAGAAVGESCPIPYVRGAFNIVVILLEIVQTMKKNRDDLRDLCDNTVKLMGIIQHQLSAHQGTKADKLMELCKEFENMMNDILKGIKQMQSTTESTRGKIREFFKSNTIAEQVNGYEKQIKTFLDHIQLAANLDTSFQLHAIATGSYLAQVNENINNCPPPSRIFHGRQAILDKMWQYFNQNFGGQHIYVLYGLGGAGKTQIALKFIQQSGARFSSTFFIDTSSIETISSGLKNIAILKKVGDTADAAKNWFTGKHEEWLIFFDNADDPKLDLNKFLPQCNHGNIIITSRNPGVCVYAGSDTQVSEMDEDEASQLLLRSAAQKTTEKNKVDAVVIVKELSCLPLAIIQAGAFIAKSRNLEGYLALYSANRSRLLSEKPIQSHDSYAWTVYTTWQISFEKLSTLAARLLQLSSFLHYEGITEEMFISASRSQVESSIVSQEELRPALEFISHFKGSLGSWDSLQFQDVGNEKMAYSLMNFDSVKKLFSMHPLVHDWCRDTITEQELSRSCMVGLVGMHFTAIPEQDTRLASIELLPHIEALVDGKTDMVPDFRAEFARVYANTGNYSKAMKFQVPALEKCRVLLGDNHQYTLSIMTQLAATNRSLGRFEEAKKLQFNVLEKCRQLLGEDHLDTLTAIVSLARTYWNLGQFEKAKELQAHVLEKRRQLLGDNHLDTILAMANLAATYGPLGQFEDAKKLKLHVLEKRQTLLGYNHPDTLLAKGNLAFTYGQLGQFEQAKKLQVHVLEKCMMLLGDDHPDTSRARGNLANTYRNLGQYEEAKKLQVHDLEKCQKLLGDGNLETLQAMADLAITYRFLGQFEEAKKLEVHVLGKRRELLGEDHPHTSKAVGNLAATYVNLGQVEEAKKLQIYVLDKYRKLLGDDCPDTLTAMANLAATYQNLGQFEEAKKLEVHVVELRRKLLGGNHPDTLQAMANLAQTYNHLGNLREAAELEGLVQRNRSLETP